MSDHLLTFILASIASGVGSYIAMTVKLAVLHSRVAALEHAVDRAHARIDALTDK